VEGETCSGIYTPHSVDVVEGASGKSSSPATRQLSKLQAARLNSETHFILFQKGRRKNVDRILHLFQPEHNPPPLEYFAKTVIMSALVENKTIFFIGGTGYIGMSFASQEHYAN
jgi:hypothetical protein